jgi:hypothetical protein
MTEPKSVDVLTAEIAKSPAVTLNDGKQYRLAFPMRAVLLYKQKTGDNLFDVENWKKLATPENMAAAFWAALSTHHPELTYDQVTVLVDFSNIKQVEAAIVECLQSYMPKIKSGNGDDPNAGPPAQ